MKWIQNKSAKLIKLTERTYRKSLCNLYQRCKDRAKRGLRYIIVDVDKIDGLYYAKVESEQYVPEQYVPYEVVKEYFEARDYKTELLNTPGWHTANILYIRW